MGKNRNFYKENSEVPVEENISNEAVEETATEDAKTEEIPVVKPVIIEPKPTKPISSGGARL